MKLSVVIPAYNEAKRIDKTVRRVKEWLAGQSEITLSQLLVVDDGSTDQTTAVATDAGAQVVPQLPNQGKGAAVKKGVLAANSDWILVMDADSATDISELAKLVPYCDQYPIIIGSRYSAGGAIKQTQVWYRRLISRLGNVVIRLLLGLPYDDTQCGFKLFSRQAATTVFSRITINRWGFDIEALTIARLKKIPVKEIGVDWYDQAGTKVRAIQAARQTLREVMVIRRNIAQGKYR